MIIGTIHLNADCTIDGAAPMLSPGTTHAAYPVKFIITDATGIVAGPFDLALEVVKVEAQGQQQGGGQQNNPNLPVLNLPAQLPPAYGGKNYSYIVNASGGAGGPYSFSMGPGSEQSLPVGLYVDWANGTIMGKTELHDNDTRYDLTICAQDNLYTGTCGNTSLMVLSTKETWAGTFQTSRPVCGSWPKEGWTYESSLSGSWTATFTIPTSLLESLAGPENYQYFGEAQTSGTWSGSESPTKECVGPSIGRAIGGSDSNVPIYAYVNDITSMDDKRPMKGKYILLTVAAGNYILPGGETYIDREGIGGQELSIDLVPASISNTTITGTVWINYAADNGIGTFTLTRVK
jgi:hypothetical protein